MEAISERAAPGASSRARGTGERDTTFPPRRLCTMAPGVQASIGEMAAMEGSRGVGDDRSSHRG